MTSKCGKISMETYTNMPYWRKVSSVEMDRNEVISSLLLQKLEEIWCGGEFFGYNLPPELDMSPEGWNVPRDDQFLQLICSGIPDIRPRRLHRVHCEHRRSGPVYHQCNLGEDEQSTELLEEFVLMKKSDQAFGFADLFVKSGVVIKKPYPPTASISLCVP